MSEQVQKEEPDLREAKIPARTLKADPLTRSGFQLDVRPAGFAGSMHNLKYVTFDVPGMSCNAAVQYGPAGVFLSLSVSEAQPWPHQDGGTEHAYLFAPWDAHVANYSGNEPVYLDDVAGYVARIIAKRFEKRLAVAKAQRAADEAMLVQHA